MRKKRTIKSQIKCTDSQDKDRARCNQSGTTWNSLHFIQSVYEHVEMALQCPSILPFTFFFFLSLVLLGPLHMEVARLGGLIRAVAPAYTTAHSNARSLIH